MKLMFIGSGSAFTVGADNYHSNMLLMDPQSGEKLLIDCGSDARHALHALSYSYQDITHVYVSHLHADHAGGLEWLALSTKFDPHCEKPHLYSNHSIIKNLWNRTLSGGMRTLQGIKANLQTFFEVHSLDENGGFWWHNIEFQTVQTIHVVAGYMFMPSFGIIFTINGKRIFITTDTQFAPAQLLDFYQKVDIIFHDCETASTHSNVHAHFTQLATLDAEIKAKMWLYHYNPGPLPNAKAFGFCGFVKRGQVFEF